MNANIKLMIGLLIMHFVAGFTMAQTYPEIRNERPRIQIDQNRLDWLKANINGGESGDTYSKFKGNYDLLWITDPKLYLAGDDSTQWTWDWESGDAVVQATMTAFLLQMETDPLAGKRCEFIVSRLVEFMNQLNFDQYPIYTKESLLREYSDIGALLLDWTHDEIPLDLRQSMTKALYRTNKIFMDEYILSESGTSYVSSHNIYNCVITLQNVLAMYYADGLSSEEQNQLEIWYGVLMEKWDQQILPVFGYYRDDDGGWNWGATYSMFSLYDQYQFFDNMLYATGKNYYEDLPWVKESINQYWYFFRPDDYTIHLGDGIITLREADRVMYRHASVYKDDRSQWLVQKFTSDAYLDNTAKIFRKLLYMDFTVPQVSHPQPPLNWWSDKVGVSVSRTSWDESSTMVWFYNAPSKRAAHEHRDNNTFSIYRHKPLVVDAGYYDNTGSSHFNNYYSRTIAHNSVCVFDASESFFNFGSRVSNDGGQIESEPLENFEDIFEADFQRGKWIQYSESDHYSYSVADAGLSYNQEKLDRFVRRLFFHKPDRVIVLDHLHLKNTETRQRDAKWINHFVNRPVISGKRIQTTVAGHIETYDGTDYTLTNGEGNLAIRTLLPGNSKVTLVGGEAYEYWVDGQNYPPDGSPNFENVHPGFWRIEVQPEEIVDSLIFLHTLKIGDNQKPSVPGGVVLQSGNSVGVDWDNQLYLFDSKGEIATDGHEVNNVKGGRSVYLMACDLMAGVYYDLLLDEQLVSTLQANSDGILEAQIALGGGSHTIVLAHSSNTGGGLPVDNKDDPVRIYPNPAKNSFTIQILDSEVEGFTISIIDTKGVLVSKRKLMKNLCVIDLKGYTNGVYILKIKYGNKSYTKRLVVL
ncbi:MAG: T9SS type A sorting domain-containing protein [Marinifilaceae bacterium]